MPESATQGRSKRSASILFGLEASEAVQFGLPAQDFIPRTIEERLIPLVDLMIEGVQPTTLDRRFSSLRKRYFKNSFLTAIFALCDSESRLDL